ncbi:MAG: thioredoxin domain-containing protein [Thermoanaerobaculia bacterium]
MKPRAWAALALLGALSALWSLFLWGQLVLWRSGGGSFCGFGGKLDCSGVWGSAFASAVHNLTGLPIAGWGLVWGITAFLLPLAGLARLAEGRSVAALTSAVRLTAGAGILAVAVFVAASIAAGAICVGCIGTYLLAGAYASIALATWRRAGFPEAGRGAALAAGCTAAAFLLLLYPGLQTPKTSGESGRSAIAAAAAASEASSVPPSRPGTGNPLRDKAVDDLVAALDPAQRQVLADSLAIYRNAPPLSLPPPRALVGSDLAPVRITEFTDILCEHCAGLHETLRTLRAHAPVGSYSVDARQFPLDGRCNAIFKPDKGDDVRCVAARARICVEPTGREPEFAAALFANQKGLTRERVLELASPFLPRAALLSCLDAPETGARLEQDIAAAARTESDGTPIVLLNGRRGTSFGPFLYAMILTRGNPDHPAFESLPTGNPAAHLH